MMLRAVFNFLLGNFRGAGCGTQPFSLFKDGAIGIIEPIEPIQKNEQNCDSLQDFKEVISNSSS